MNAFKQKISEEIKQVLLQSDTVFAAWEGGSAATGFEDSYSDLDLAVLSGTDHVEDVFVLISHFLEKQYGILHSIRMPEPAWHGMSQCFYFINGAPDFFYIDLAVMKEDVKDPLLEKERHGHAKVWFDKKNFVVPVTIDMTKYQQKMRDLYKHTVAFFPLLFVEFKKNATRGSIVETWKLYNNILGQFIAVMNLKYRPAKFDFQSRYIERDYPADEAMLIQSLCMPKTMTEMKSNGDYIEKRFKDICKELANTYGDVS